ncbi:TPA: tRNA (guanosine(37)-N1)-methyltransferase TrmD [Candidatus Nomurabacteria bacterium]|nr:MAG: tRNA (guanine-N(1)-)-methyltransferase [Parcubacteria bacterium RAAC4_OD1_1]HCY26574.1 tRNA (guanosine(37)-N1)-methyltransferase TrmD [Candidatus Nomurabacteria bacterium]
MNFHVVTLFKEMFDSYLGESILGRAIKEKKISVSFVNPRLFVKGKYKKIWPDGNVSLQIDDRPYGGGPGMVMMAEPVISAVESIIKKISKKKNSKILIINFIPSAEKFTTTEAKKISRKYTDVIFICGRYEGIDRRLDKILKTKKYSIGDYVLTGGEIPAMVLIDSISRQVEGVLGNFNSREEERVSSSEVYTRPEVIEYKGKKYRVPKVLLSGNHKDIENWKQKTKNKK